MSTLPEANGCAEVHLFNHENGEFEGRWGSIANFVARHFSPQDENEDDDGELKDRPWGKSPRVAQNERAGFYVCMRFCGQERVVRAWLQTASREDVLAMLTKPAAEYVAFTDLLAAHAVSRWADAARAACVSALEQRVSHASALHDYMAENEPVIHQLALVVASLGEKKKLAELAKPFGDYGIIADVFARTTKFEPAALTHDWEGPITLSNVLHGDCKLELDLSSNGKRVDWKSRGEGLNMNNLVEGQSFADGGVLTFATPADARAYADAELRAAALLGFSRPKEAKKAKSRR